MFSRKNNASRFHQIVERCIFAPDHFAAQFMAKRYFYGRDRTDDNGNDCADQNADVEPVFELHAPKAVGASHQEISFTFSKRAFTGPVGVSKESVLPS